MPQDESKKDLTGLTMLPDHPVSDKSDDSSAIPAPAFTDSEKVDAFESIEELGMIDHPIEEETEITPEPETALDHSPELEQAPVQASEPPFEPLIESPVLTEIRTYAENAQESISENRIFYPFHLRIHGLFGPFERDKLLRFITENPIGVSSADLDLQIQSGKVFFPRISEFSGIKLIQELRDSGLDFSLAPSDQEEIPSTRPDRGVQFRYKEPSSLPEPSTADIPILPTGSELTKKFEEFDSIQSIQFLKTEMVEAEKSVLFQEAVQRMIESMKHKARLRGAHAVTGLEQKITPLRLPSQYQVTLQMTLLRKIENP